MGRKAILAVAMALVFSSPNVWAREKSPQGLEGHGGMSETLSLTADQKTRMKAVGAAHKAEAKPLQEQAKIKMKELKALVASKAGDDAINAKLAEVKTIRAAMQELRNKFMEQRMQILTPEQRAQMTLKMGGRNGEEKGEKSGMNGRKGMKGEKEDKKEAGE